MSMKMSTEKTTWTKEELLFAVTTLQNANEYINTSETDMVVKSRAILLNVQKIFRIMELAGITDTGGILDRINEARNMLNKLDRI